MHDKVNEELKINDLVATNQNGYTCSLVIAKVIDFTKCKIRLLNLSSLDTFYKYPEQVVVITKWRNP